MTSHSDPPDDQERPPASSELARPTPADVDLVFDLLSHRHRRATLRYLHRVDTPVSLDTLAAGLAAMITHPENAHSTSRVDRIRTVLYHTHLPLLADADVIDYDHERDRITLAESDPAISNLLTDVLDTTLDM